jgi:hypothetical protein
MPTRARRWRWALTAVLLAGVAGLVVLAVTGVLGDRGRYRGEVTVVACTFLTYRPHGSAYTCAGSFAGGDIRIPVVTFTNDGRLDAGTRVAATVSGPDARTANLVSESRWRLIVSGAGAVLLLAVLVQLWRAPRSRR